MSKNNGGPAFPLPVKDANCCARLDSGYGGMTLRDYFAAKALQGILADSKVEATPTEFAAASYRMADAMLKAREVGNE